MILRLIEDEILASWKALSNSGSGIGWQTVPVTSPGDCRIMAARHFPENDEALLVGFNLEVLPMNIQLPEGKGFRVEKIRDVRLGQDQTWIGLIRQDSGSLEIFLTMVRDILTMVSKKSDVSPIALFSAFIGRIRAWQDFMSKPRAVLGAEAEVGLFGELTFLGLLIDSGLSISNAVESWYGPLGGLQDFMLGHGAIEIKTTLAEKGFPAKVHSLEQLDDSIVRPIFLGAVRLRQNISGCTLAKLIDDIRERLSRDKQALSEFDNRLLRVGYLDSQSEHYTRSFLVIETRNFLVDERFPRMTSGSVPSGVKSAKYEIDIDQVAAIEVPLLEVYRELGID
ncbi:MULTISPECIES: PD-(D/E)XK motif protein [Shewanella]|uniref:PD-(D/E)XK motif protein n=1 Tax=Shewanella TaxID=22 RepID=UPI0014302AD1|nr:PD-(D/E)XK motif protein [Shewanella sp. Iso12]NJI86472.1 PD-(D/E)XK motif protein [Shewanella sp. Iso12]